MLNAFSKKKSVPRGQDGELPQLNPRPVPLSATALQTVTPSAIPREGQGVNWSPWLAIVFVVVVFFASQIAAAVVLSFAPSLLFGWSSDRTTDWLNTAISAQFFYVLLAEALVIGGLIWFLKLYKRDFRTIGFRRPRWSDLGYGLAFVPLYYISYIAIVAVSQQLVPSLNVDQPQQLGFDDPSGFLPLAMTFISLVVLPPLVEETLMRGYLYTSLKKGLPTIGAALITSAIFASAHLEAGSGAPLLWVAAIDTFVLSLFLIWLREKTGSVWACVALHALKNFVAFASLFIFHLG